MEVEQRALRDYWVVELAKLSGSFGSDSSKMIEELRLEISEAGSAALLAHLRLCGAIPEHYGHDSSEEKLYSKYTDAVVSEALGALGLRSAVIDARGDAADVQAHGTDYTLVADAKAFRLTRTAKNQKDFKVQAMDGWRGGLDYAVVVCPIYQLPSRTSQIYQQAISRNVCVLSFSHLAALVGLADRRGVRDAEAGLHEILQTVGILHPSKNALDYWSGINRALREALSADSDLWELEKVASLEALQIVKEEALGYLQSERDRLLGLSHEEAVSELVRRGGFEARMARIERLGLGRLLEEC